MYNVTQTFPYPIVYVTRFWTILISFNSIPPFRRLYYDETHKLHLRSVYKAFLIFNEVRKLFVMYKKFRISSERDLNYAFL